MNNQGNKAKTTKNATRSVDTSTERISLPAPYINASYNALCDAFLTLKTRAEMRAFIRDLCTEQEIEELTNRFAVAGMLQKKFPYVTIEQQTGMSTATIARIKQWLYGGMGGYRIALARTTKHHMHHANAFARSGV